MSSAANSVQVVSQLKELAARVESLSVQIGELEERHKQLEGAVDHNAELQDTLSESNTYLRDIIDASNVYHDDFWPRAWAIWGHAIVPGLIISGGFYLVIGVLLGVSM